MTGSRAKDHSSAALIALLGGHLADHAPSLIPDWMPSADALDNGRIEIDAKRRLIDHVMLAGGARYLIGVGASMHHIRHLPIADILMMSRDTDNLAVKWQRLERYVHSRHQTRIDASGRRSWHCRHISMTDEAPMPGEDLLVCGLISGILHQFGCQGMEIGMAGRSWLIGDPDAFHGFEVPDCTAEWRISWQEHVPLPAQPCAIGGHGAETRLAVGEAADCARYIADDLSAPRNIAQTAKDLGRSTRTLQRELSRAGFTFSSLTRGVRVEAAAGMLQKPDLTLAGIGFVCGFSDQAHFQRDFKRVMGMTPGQYRENLAEPA